MAAPIPGALDYDEAVELAATLYRGRRLAEMALAGDLGMRRVPEADRPATEAMLADLKSDHLAVQKVTRLGRAPVPVASVLP
jgi:hypothetical protein